MLFNMFHLMPYRHLDMTYTDTYDSASLILPNAYYDRELGSDLYNEYLDQLEYAEKLGFDAVCINEHHSTAYGLMPAPNVIAAMLARRTERVKIAILGNAAALRDHPLRVAEEVAMLDNITKGRIISGFVRGIGWEYYAQSINPLHSRERFEESHDLIVKAWKSRDVFEWHSKHYHFRYVNVWPQPYQDPHPPIWVPGTGSPETMKWVAERHYNYMSVYAPSPVVKRWFDGFRKAAVQSGYEPAKEQVGLSIPIFVGRTHEEAMEKARPHIEALFTKLIKLRAELRFPAGYLSQGGLRGLLTSGAKQLPDVTWEDVIRYKYAIVGSAESVTEQLGEMSDDMGFGNLLALLQIGTMNNEETIENMERFARGVMPNFTRTAPEAVPAASGGLR
ncbi:LLM class flavin-dependent oxidoreductase [Streptomyces sp. 6N223]|uniref:LLM class flavin-dependent oxidoreductase n=1 Tax=Streptomyces sp. 6N223 TaxID=3457412 RepID=UPI003FD54BFF